MKTAREWAENLLVAPAAIELTTPLFLQVQVDALRHAMNFGPEPGIHSIGELVEAIEREAARIERGEAPHVFKHVES